MQRSHFIQGLGGAALLAAPGAANGVVLPRRAHANALSQKVQHIVDGYVEQQVAAGLSFAAVVAGVIAPGLNQLFFAGAPVSAKDHTNVGLDGNTQYLIASITKTFASQVFLRRFGDYGGTLAEHITTGFPPNLAALKIIDLVNYSPGFPTDDFGGVWWTYLGANDLNTLLTNLAAASLLPQCTPGTLYSYSNFGWGLLGLAALHVTSHNQPVAQEWSDAIAHVCAEAGLSSLTQPRDVHSTQALIAGYSHGTLLPTTYTYNQANWATLFACGDLVSTGNDMLAWLEFNMGLRGGRLADFKRQQSPVWSWLEKIWAQPNGTLSCPPPESPPNPPVVVSPAWFHFSKSWNPSVTYLTKNGAEKGFNSWIGFNPWVDTGSPSQYGAFALANVTSGADDVGNKLIKLLLA